MGVILKMAEISRSRNLKTELIMLITFNTRILFYERQMGGIVVIPNIRLFHLCLNCLEVAK